MTTTSFRRGGGHRPLPSGEVRTRGLGRRFLSALPQYAAVSPYFIIFAIFGLVPVVFTMGLAFTSWSGLGDVTFIGWTNFEFLIDDPLFYRALSNTLVLWVMSTVPCLTLATLVALALHSTLRFSTVYRVIYLLPNITSMVAMGILFGSIFSSQFGVANALLNVVGIDSIPWLKTEWGIKVAIATLSAWSFVGYNALMILAGLQAIPKSTFEAAAIDGAGPVRRFFHITLPQLRPIVLFITLMSTIGSLQSFTEAQVLTSAQSSGAASAGGLGNSGLTMVLYFYSVAFQENRYGYGAAIAWAVFVIVIFFSILNWVIVRGRNRNGR